MIDWAVRQRRLLGRSRAADGAQYEAERTYTVKANKDVLDRLDKLLAYVSWCSGVGHSCTVGMDIDGDGADRIKVEGTVSKVNEDDVLTRSDRAYEQLK